MQETKKINKEDKTKYLMADAVKTCMRTTPVEDITVRQIAEVSGLTRQTFYRHFKDKNDLINWYFDIILHESFERMGQGETIYDGLLRKFNYIKEEALFFSAGFRNDEQNNLKDHDFRMIHDFYRNMIHDKTGEYPDTFTDSVLEMYCQSSVYMTVKWVLNDMPSSPKELADIMIAAMPPSLAEQFEKLHVLG